MMMARVDLVISIKLSRKKIANTARRSGLWWATRLTTWRKIQSVGVVGTRASTIAIESTKWSTLTQIRTKTILWWLKKRIVTQTSIQSKKRLTYLLRVQTTRNSKMSSKTKTKWQPLQRKKTRKSKFRRNQKQQLVHLHKCLTNRKIEKTQ